jgi:uncharacterized SAM-binding protein YcdF (DUF218 family)
MFSSLSFLKPWLSAWLLAPASLLVLMGLGALLAWLAGRNPQHWLARWRRAGQLGFALSFLALWLLCCQGFAAFLERSVLRPPPALAPEHVQARFVQDGIEAIVVLGGGLQPNAPEYGQAQLSDSSVRRLHYAAFLARRSGLPLAFSGGKGWADAQSSSTEAELAALWLKQLGLAAPKWLDAQSKDTAGNALFMARLLQSQGVQRIALVTHASHMPRAKLEFEAAGFTVLPAPTQFIGAQYGMGLDWFASAQGLLHSRRVLHEILGLLLVGRL